MSDHAALAETPDGSSDDRGEIVSAADADVLSQLLALVRLRGREVYSLALEHPWQREIAPGSCHFHLIEKGAAVLHVGGEAPLTLGPGDLILLPHGRGHRLSSGEEREPTHLVDSDVARPIGKMPDAVETVSSTTRLVGGVFDLDTPVRELILSALPVVLRLSYVGPSKPPWLAGLTHFLLAEAEHPLPGSSLMISRMIDLVVIRVLRSWAAAQPSASGWLGGMAHPRIGRAMYAIHQDPARTWSVGDLAARAAMSRSMFAERFTQVVGEAPLRYVTRWRMALAADLLRRGHSVGEASRLCGYGSEAGFSRAFKAHCGQPPGTLHPRFDRSHTE
ncbi:AraC family transcriptional regulator [Bradyrhizobium sp. LA7.1]|uniref:AraC family transcriptional regulator n=1 Tax=Bradyrhizobium sp. LA7.1 TaxID=3156324 RepID=UPI00339400A0